MGILSRMKTIFKSEVNASLDKAEDTEKMLNQTVLDMQEQLAKAKQQVAIAIADEKRLERSYLENQQLTEQWMDKAKLAVQKGSDELAKAALERKAEYEGLAAEYQKQWVAQKDAVEKLKVSLRDLERKVEEAKRQKDLLIARNKRAIAQKQIHQTMAGMNTNAGVFNTFDRMKRKVDDQEARAEAAQEMAEETGDAKLDKQFRELGKSNIDDELAKLKSQVSDAPKPEDPELAKLKEEIKK
jgi:phage shock protein A